MAALEHVEPNDRTQRFNWIGRAGCVFFRKSFVVRWVWASTLGLKHEPQLGPRLALASSCERIQHAIPFLPTESLAKPERFNWIGRAGCVFFRKSFVVRSLRALNRPAPRSRLVLRKNPPRHPFPPN
jgi:lipid-A-disaccharide synthase-like uncharacterized protein